MLVYLLLIPLVQACLKTYNPDFEDPTHPSAFNGVSSTQNAVVSTTAEKPCSRCKPESIPIYCHGDPATYPDCCPWCKDAKGPVSNDDNGCLTVEVSCGTGELIRTVLTPITFTQVMCQDPTTDTIVCADDGKWHYYINGVEDLGELTGFGSYT